MKGKKEPPGGGSFFMSVRLSMAAAEGVFPAAGKTAEEKG